MREEEAFLDIEKPKIVPGEYLCDACWRVSRKSLGWSWYNFKTLDPIWLCYKCIDVHGEDMIKKQKFGL